MEFGGWHDRQCRNILSDTSRRVSMGISTSTHYSLTCKGCGAVDTPSAHQRGFAYSGGNWSGPDSNAFSLRTEELHEEDAIKPATFPCAGRC